MLRHRSHPKLSELAEEIGADRRTVQRYIETMRDRLGAEIVYDEEQRGYRYADAALEVPPARLTDDELLALYVAEPILAQYRGTPLEEDFARAFAHRTERGDVELMERVAYQSPLVHWPMRYASAIVAIDEGDKAKARTLLDGAPEWPSESAFRGFHEELASHAR